MIFQTRSNSFGTERTENRAKEEDFITGPRETGLGEKKPPEHLLRLSTTNLDTNSNPKRNDQPVSKIPKQLSLTLLCVGFDIRGLNDLNAF